MLEPTEQERLSNQEGSRGMCGYLWEVKKYIKFCRWTGGGWRWEQDGSGGGVGKWREKIMGEKITIGGL